MKLLFFILLPVLNLVEMYLIPINSNSQMFFHNRNGAFSYGYNVGLNTPQLLSYINQPKNLNPNSAEKSELKPAELHSNKAEIDIPKPNHLGKSLSTISEADDLNKPEEEDQTADSFDGSYSFSYHGENSFRQESSDSDNNVKGTYFFTDSTGIHDLSYVAGSETGFLPTGGNLAQPNGLENSGPVIFYKIPFDGPDKKDSSYSFEFSAPDHSRQEIGDKNGNIYGHYSFVNEEGTHDLRYTAGKDIGFLPLGGSLARSVSPPERESVEKYDKNFEETANSKQTESASVQNKDSIKNKESTNAEKDEGRKKNEDILSSVETVAQNLQSKNVFSRTPTVQSYATLNSPISYGYLIQY